MPHRTGPVAEEFASRVAAMESEWLSPLAVRSYETRGRLHAEGEICPLRTPFQRDRDRIMHCKAFRRLKHKTQVFIAPQGDHYRTRLTHTLEVSGISRNVARALRLNEDLTEAIALGHDLGHSPFGHAGEGALDRVLEERYGRAFHHNEHSLRIVDVLEHEGRGLNLTEEVRDGILHHTGEVEPDTLEGAIVRLVDRFAYVNHDIDDAVRAGILDPARAAREPDRPARRDVLAADRRPGARPRRDVPEVGGDRPDRGAPGGAARASRLHVRPGLPAARRPASRPARWSGSSRTCWRTSSSTLMSCRPGSRAMT